MSYIPFPAYYDDAPIDLRFVYKNEKPAGKRGFLKCVGDHFEFEDGTPARFWGVNFNGGCCFPDKKTAERIALRLAKYGVNMVRYHQLDAEWDIPNVYGLTRGARACGELDPEALDRLDYLTYCLKKEGIYVYIDVFTYRRFKTEEGIVNAHLLGDAGKPYHSFNRRMIELQKKTIYDFFNHYNPYTGLTNKDDPVFAMGEIVNEADVFYIDLKHEPYISEFRSLFRCWLDERGIEYDAENCEINEAGKPVTSYPVVEEFKLHVTREYFREMYSYMREVGIKFPICGTNEYIRDALLEANHTCDFLDGHSYFYDWQWQNLICASNPITRAKRDPLGHLARSRTFDKPYFISEWDMPWPNAYRAESPLVYAAISSFQNFGGAAIHAYAYSNRLDRMHLLGKEVSCDTIGGTRYREGIFSTWNDPAKFGLFYHAALLFRRGDVAQSGTKLGVKGSCGEDGKTGRAYYCASEHTKIANVYPSEVGADKIVTPDTENVNLDDGFVRSDTGELYRSWEKGYGTIDTKRTKCAYGSLAENGKIELDGLTIDCATDFAVIALSSLTDDALDKTDHILLTAVGRAENTDARFEGDKMVELGHAPIITEVIEADIALRTGKTNLAIWAVNAEGFYVGRLPVTYEDGVAKFKIGDTHKSIYYVIYEE